MQNRILIDGDILVYKIACSVETETFINELNIPEAEVIKHGITSNFLTALDAEGIAILWSDFNNCKLLIDDKIKEYQELFNTTDMVIAVTGKENFRKSVYPEYKANRKDSRKPLCLTQCKEYLISKYGAIGVKGLEADDILGIESTDPKHKDKKNIIISIDKDFKQIPGYWWSPMSDSVEPLHITEEDADWWLYIQALQGDMVDNYPGCKGIGEVGAQKLIHKGMTKDEAWKVIVKTFEKAGFDEEFALQMIRCAKLLRYGDYKDGKVLLWGPDV